MSDTKKIEPEKGSMTKGHAIAAAALVLILLSVGIHVITDMRKDNPIPGPRGGESREEILIADLEGKKQSYEQLIRVEIPLFRSSLEEDAKMIKAELLHLRDENFHRARGLLDRELSDLVRQLIALDVYSKECQELVVEISSTIRRLQRLQRQIDMEDLESEYVLVNKVVKEASARLLGEIVDRLDLTGVGRHELEQRKKQLLELTVSSPDGDRDPKLD